MPSARSAQTAAARSARSSARSGSGSYRAGAAQATARRQPRARPEPRPRPRRVTLRASAVRVRWERVGRIALLVVLAAVVGVYAAHALSYVSTREQATRARASYVQTAREHRVLRAEVRSLRQPATIVQQARRLGMIRAGEQPYAMLGQSSGR